MNERFKMIASVYALFIKDGKVLLSRRYQTGYEDGNYSVPAGHVENGESMTEAVIREAKEEVGVDLKPEDVEVKTVMHRRQEDIRVDFLFEVKRWEGEPYNTEPERCDDLSWFPLDNLPPNTISYVRQVIECYRKGIIYSEWGW
jgi:8-oxo-dGTP diphosphatase